MIFLISSNSLVSAKITSGTPLLLLLLMSIFAKFSTSSMEYSVRSFFALFVEIFPDFTDSKISLIFNRLLTLYQY